MVGPKTVPGVDLSRDSVIDKYKRGVAERAAKTKAAPSLGGVSLPQAQASFNPKRDAPMTLMQMGEAQQNVNNMTEQKSGGLKPETVKGLQALHDAVNAQNAARAASQPATPAPLPGTAAPPASAPAPAAEPKPVSKETRDTLSTMDDLELERLIRGVQTDVINNETERKAVAKRVKAIDILAGIATGEFTQLVSIIPGKLDVLYRSISAHENQAIRLLLFKWIDEDKRRENISAELFGLMQTVASIVQVNGNRLPAHMQGSDPMSLTFDETAFRMKFDVVSRYPAPLIHALGTHGMWFDQRVRETFTAENLKNS